MKARELKKLGVPDGRPVKAVSAALGKAVREGLKHKELRKMIRALVAEPTTFQQDPIWGPSAAALLAYDAVVDSFVPRAAPAPYRQWGDDLEAQAIEQMEQACALPVAVKGALMPDAHMGYGLPIGGVLAVKNAVIPYAVGMDIACRMRLSVLDLPVSALSGQADRLANALERETSFGVGAKFRQRKDHAVMDADWQATDFLARLKKKAWAQLGTSGSGNHFVEFGELTLDRTELGLEPGTYLALLSHSGSRGAGGQVAQHYSKLAMDRHPELPRQLKHLAWLEMDGEAGQEYWTAMEMMGRYAAANHELIHRAVVKNLGAKVIAEVENHHNFAWREEHDGDEVIVHRKGATPARAGVLGIIPGSMATPGYVIRGKGKAEALFSASHGAGRAMSRTAAKRSYTWSDLKKFLAKQNVTLLSAGLDEVPMAYKNIEVVMDAQQDLVERVAKFTPRLVKMAPGHERPED